MTPRRIPHGRAAARVCEICSRKLKRRERRRHCERCGALACVKCASSDGGRPDNPRLRRETCYDVAACGRRACP